MFQCVDRCNLSASFLSSRQAIARDRALFSVFFVFSVVLWFSWVCSGRKTEKESQKKERLERTRNRKKQKRERRKICVISVGFSAGNGVSNWVLRTSDLRGTRLDNGAHRAQGSALGRAASPSTGRRRRKKGKKGDKKNAKERI